MMQIHCGCPQRRVWIGVVMKVRGSFHIGVVAHLCGEKL